MLGHILVVDDDRRLRELLRRYLCGEGFSVSTVDCVSDARQAMAFFRFHCLIVDIMMPQTPGTDLLALPAPYSPPILLLSAMGEASDRIAGLQLGAQDYLVKPFEPKELVLRLQRILQHHSPKKELRLDHDLTYSLMDKNLRRCDKILPLTLTEKNLLDIFACSPDLPLTRQEIAEKLAYADYNARTVDMQINRLRQKIEQNPKAPVILQSVRGKGYRLVCFS